MPVRERERGSRGLTIAAVMIGLTLILGSIIGYAWIGGDREPLRTIVIPVRPATAR